MAHLFLIGSGFIGGTVLTDLLKPENKKKLGLETISVLTRKDGQATRLEQLGLVPVRGDLDSADVIANEVEKSDVVVHTATADHLSSVQAVLTGLGKRANAGKPTVYLHTSGAAVLDDDSKGLSGDYKVFSDDDPDGINALPDTAPHRDVDLALVKGCEELGKLGQKIGIIMPPLIYGRGTGPFHTKSIQAPSLIKVALQKGQTLAVGKGKNVWSEVHVRDLADGYVLILVHLIKAKTPAQAPWNPYFFVSNGDFSWSELYSGIASAGSAHGLLKSSDIRFDADQQLAEALDFPLDVIYVVFGSNSVARADRLKKLGWKPKAAKGNEDRPDLIGSIRDDVIKVADELGLRSKS